MLHKEQIRVPFVVVRITLSVSPLRSYGRTLNFPAAAVPMHSILLEIITSKSGIIFKYFFDLTDYWLCATKKTDTVSVSTAVTVC